MNNDISFWILVASVIVVIVAAIISVSILLTKIIKLRNKTRKANTEANMQGIEKLMNRDDRGDIDKEFYQSNISQLSDEQIEFSINTIIRNSYKKGIIIGENNAYEAINFIQKTKCTIDLLNKNINDITKDKINKSQYSETIKIIEEIKQENKFDFIMIKEKVNWVDYAKKYFNNLNDLGLLFFFNSFDLKKEKKILNTYFETNNIKHEEMKFANGIILAVKK